MIQIPTIWENSRFLTKIRENPYFRVAWRALWTGAIAAAGTLLVADFSSSSFSWGPTITTALATGADKAWRLFIKEAPGTKGDPAE